MAKEDEIKIPESVLNRASAAARRGQAIADTGSIFTEREREMPRQSGGMGYPSGPFQQGGLPRFPFGGLPSTSLDVVNRSNSSIFPIAPTEGFNRTNPSAPFDSARNEQNVQYEQDAGSRMANRYLLPTAGIAQQNITFGSPFGNRFSATDYVDPRQARQVEGSNTNIATMSPISSSPDIGAAGFSRRVEQDVLGQGRTEQVVSPYGFASTTLTPQQVEQRAQARQQAEQAGTMPRTPEQQQALIDNIRKNAPALNQQRTDWVQNTIQKRRENPTTYTTPSGMSVAVPTNRFGEPLKAWTDQLGGEGRLKTGPRQAPQSTVTMFPSVVSSGKFETANSFKPSESFTGSMASNYAPPTTSGFGNRTRISGGKRNSSPMSEGIMSAFDFGMSVVPSYMPNSPVIPQNNAIAMGMNQSPFGSGFSAIF